MDEPTVVTNQDDQEAPPDLVVLAVTPGEMADWQRKAVLGLDWYIPDKDAHPDEQDTILVKYNDLHEIWNARPEAPADHGLDPLVAVEYIEPARRKLAPPNIDTHDGGRFYTE